MQKTEDFKNTTGEKNPIWRKIQVNKEASMVLHTQTKLNDNLENKKRHI